MIREQTVDELLKSLKANKGRFCFFIGAGTSRAAGIPLASELIEQWQRQKYEFEMRQSKRRKAFDKWIAKREEDTVGIESQYGYWFEQNYPTPGERQRFIAELVEGKTPTFGIISLSAIMAEGWIPACFTTNFDDLLYDSFYLFLAQKPLVINHDALAPQMRLTDTRPKIIKLHGDYLYDNLKNTEIESERLTENMERVFSQCLGEYGLVVVGYGGNDKSIFKILQGLLPRQLPYGLWWCVVNGSGRESLSQRTEELLENSQKSFLVQIPGAEELFLSLWTELGIRRPRQAEIKDRAEERIRILQEATSEATDLATGKERDVLQVFASAEVAYLNAQQLHSQKKYKEAIDSYSAAIEKDPEYSNAYWGRALAYGHLEQFQESIKDYSTHLSLEGDEDVSVFLNRCEAFVCVGDGKRALMDALKCLELAGEDANHRASALMLIVISRRLLREEVVEEKTYRQSCNESFDTTWDFKELDSWLEKAELPKAEKKYIAEMVKLLKKHQRTPEID